VGRGREGGAKGGGRGKEEKVVGGGLWTSTFEPDALKLVVGK